MILSGLFQKLISAESPESPKAAVLLTSCWTLCLIAGSLGAACSIRILAKGEIGMGAAGLLFSICTLVAGLAGFHRQSDPINQSMEGGGLNGQEEGREGLLSKEGDQ